MCYYDSWFEENWCEEPREEEMALIEAIKKNVKQYIKQEMERLRKEQKTQTNADKIRSMTDEELYDFLCSFASRYTDISSPCAFRAKLFYVMGWLKQPAKED